MDEKIVGMTDAQAAEAVKHIKLAARTGNQFAVALVKAFGDKPLFMRKAIVIKAYEAMAYLMKVIDISMLDEQEIKLETTDGPTLG